MGKDFANNRSSAPTPELLGQFNTGLLTAVKEAFEAGVLAGKVEIVLTDAQVDKIVAAIKPLVIAQIKK